MSRTRNCVLPGISYPKSRAGQAVFVINHALVEIFQAVAIHKKPRALVLHLQVALDGSADGHGILQTGTAAFFDGEPQSGRADIQAFLLHENAQLGSRVGSE